LLYKEKWYTDSYIDPVALVSRFSMDTLSL
jgi:hypothetical protein